MTRAAKRRADSRNAQIGAALDAVDAELGPGALHRGGPLLAEFADPYRAEGDERVLPVAVVQPVSTEQVQAVVRIANRFGVPLWTSSQGRNHGYGGAEARTEASIALSLRRMNRVLEVNAEQGYAVVEPGVTFFDLYEALRGTGLWLSCPDLGRGSVVGNALDHGVGYTPYGDHTDRLCGLEVVLPDGRVLRTGTGGVTGSPNWHVHRRGYGPSLDGLFVQSNLGIVTRAGVWVMPEPEVYAPGQVTVAHEDDLAVLVDTLRPLMLDGTIQGYPQIVHASGPVREGTGSGHWIMRCALYGPSEVVAAQERRMRDAFRAIPGATVDLRRYGRPFTADSVAVLDQVPAGIPNLEVLNLLDAWGGEAVAGHLDFVPVTPFTGRDAVAAFRTLSEHFDRHDVKSVYTLVARGRSLVHVNMMMYRRNDVAAVRATQRACRELIDAMNVQGYGPCRTHPDHADALAGTYDFNGHVLSRTLRTLKDALDPNGVLAPGAAGIWPSRIGPGTLM